MNVLIVGDDPNLRDAFAAELVRAGHGVRVAGDPAEGMVALNTDPPDILLLDLQLGRGRGLEVARAAGRNGAATRVIVVAGSGDLTRGEILDLTPAVAALLRKPVDIETLAAAVDGAAAGDLHALRAEARRPRT